jgi:hypothetical protein
MPDRKVVTNLIMIGAQPDAIIMNALLNDEWLSSAVRGKGRNRGAAHAKGTFLAFTDADLAPDSTGLQAPAAVSSKRRII